MREAIITSSTPIEDEAVVDVRRAGTRLAALDEDYDEMGAIVEVAP